MPQDEGLLAGVAAVIDEWCGLAVRRNGGARRRTLSSKKTAILLSEEVRSQSMRKRGDVLTPMLARIESNWRSAGCRGYSSKTWVLRQCIAPTAEKKQEETLERVITEALGKRWSNQLATCSGLIKNRNEGRRSVDLVHDLGGGRYEFIELKYKDGEGGRYGSDNPLHAAWEIVCYGLLYLLTRQRMACDAEKPVLSAEEVRLVVLAPAGY